MSVKVPSSEYLPSVNKQLFDEEELMEEIHDFETLNGNLNDLIADEDFNQEGHSPMEVDDEGDKEISKDESGSEAEHIETNLGLTDASSRPTYDISLLNQRIKDSLLILGDFKARAPSGLTRKACLDSLMNDLCQRYSYNRYMMNMLYDLFPKEVGVDL